MSRARLGATLALSIAVAAGCSTESITETPFVRTATEAASLLSAASYTLQYLHEEPARLTVEYSSASLFNYAELVDPIPDELPTLEGAPDATSVQALVDLVSAALADLHAPCLVGECGWQAQVNRIEAAKSALLEAAE
jgi:hypothetical protein